MTKKNISSKVKKISNTDWKRKLTIYGGNILAGAVGNHFNYNIGNPLGAIVFGGLDLSRYLFPNIKDNKYIRLAEVTGTVVYGCKIVSDTLQFINGDLNSLAQIPFDAGMLYETGRSAFKDYNGLSWSKIKKDAINVKNDIVGGANSIEKRVDEKYNKRK